MLFRLVSSVKRKGSSNRQFVQRIPADVRSRVAGAKLYIPVGSSVVPLVLSPSAQSVRVSLRTAEASEAKIRQAQVAAYLESYWEALRKNRPIALTNREAAALGGELYRSWAEEERSTKQASITFNPDGTTTYEEGMEHDVPEEWDAILERIEINRETAGIDALESMLGPIANRLLSRKGIFVLEASSRLVVLNALFDGLRDAFRNRRRNAAGDYSPDINAQRFPEWPSKAPTADPIRGNPNSSTNSLTALVEDWWTEAKAAGRSLSTYESYKATFTRFSAFVGHDDYTRVTTKDVLGYKDHRLKQGISPKTVGASDIAALADMDRCTHWGGLQLCLCETIM